MLSNETWDEAQHVISAAYGLKEGTAPCICGSAESPPLLLGPELGGAGWEPQGRESLSKSAAAGLVS